MMEGDKQTRQWISALMDSELAHLTAAQIDGLHRSEEQKNTWSIYHQIGDILRFEHQALSYDFQVKLSNRLDQQPECELPKQKYAELATLASKKILFLVAALVIIVVVPSTVLIVKSSLSLLEKKARDDVPNNAPNNAAPTKINSLHIPVHLAQ
jgi:negative regulator of sigma E activity